MSERGWVTELPDGRLQYQERTNDKPWYDPYPEHPDPAENVRRSTQRAYERQSRAVKAIDEYRQKLQAKAPAPKPDTVTTSNTTTSTPKRSFFSKLTGKK